MMMMLMLPTAAVLLPSRAPVLARCAVATPRCPAPTADLGLLFGPLVQGKAEEAKKAQNLLGLVSRAAASRGKADLDALRAFANLLGVGGDLDAFEASLGLSSTNSTDPSGELVNKLFDGLGSAVTARMESPRERRITLALSVGLAIVLCEAAQFSLVLSLAWLLGAGLSSAGLPFGAALSVAVSSRATTRPIRLAAEVWASMAVRRAIQRAPPRRRPRLALRGVLVVVGTLATLCVLLTRADVLLYAAGATAPLDAPLVRLCGFAPPRVGAVAGAVCAFLCARARDATAASEVVAAAAMRIKPLRALLELAETDAWLLGSLARVWQR